MLVDVELEFLVELHSTISSSKDPMVTPEDLASPQVKMTVVLTVAVVVVTVAAIASDDDCSAVPSYIVLPSQ